MKNEVLVFKNNIKTKSLFFLTVLVFAFPILPNAIQSISILLFIGLSIIDAILKKTYRFQRKHVLVYTISTFWVVFLCLTIFYSEDMAYGVKMAQRYINVLAIPLILIFFIPKKILQNSHYFYLSFILSNLLFVVIIYYNAILVLEATCYPEIYYKNFFEKLNFILKKPNHIIFSCFENESKHSFFIHRVYNSMNFLFSILLLIELFFMKKFNKSIAFYLLSITCFIVFGYLIFYQFSVVNVFLSILLIPLFIIIKVPSFKAKKILFVSVFAMAAVLIIINLNYPSNKVAVKYVTPAVNLVKKTFTGNHYKSVDERYEINIANKDLIKDAYLLGYGIGDVQNKLNSYYYQRISNSKSYMVAYKKKLNTHNNYAFFLLCGGLVLLILFLINVVFSIYIGALHKSWIYIFFLIVIIVNLMFENILSRIHGTLFYAIFNGFFIARMIHIKNKD